MQYLLVFLILFIKSKQINLCSINLHLFVLSKRKWIIKSLTMSEIHLNFKWFANFKKLAKLPCKILNNFLHFHSLIKYLVIHKQKIHKIYLNCFSFPSQIYFDWLALLVFPLILVNDPIKGLKRFLIMIWIFTNIYYCIGFHV